MIGCTEAPIIYRYDRTLDQLVPAEEFEFPIEVYEQGRINRLRDDLGRQLEMLDEFAGAMPLKRRRIAIAKELIESRDQLAPLLEEREELTEELAKLPQLKKDLKEKSKHLPGTEEEKWSKASTLVHELEAIQEGLEEAIGELPDGPITDPEASLEYLFGREAPEFEKKDLTEVEILEKWQQEVAKCLERLSNTRAEIQDAVNDLQEKSKKYSAEWRSKRKAYDRAWAARLSKAGVDSPEEVVRSVGKLRKEIHALETKRQPRLVEVQAELKKAETRRGELLEQLEALDSDISEKRELKANELTAELEGQIKIGITKRADQKRYKQTLAEICEQITTKDLRIQKREEQLRLVVSRLSPIDLARALRNDGRVTKSDDSSVTLAAFCGVTDNTQRVLCAISNDIELLNRLETVEVPDMIKIQVKRRGESTYASLRSGLSPGEQSAAVLTLALQTRRMPLILDQPEDELGYSLVVHLIVPRILQSKFSRQLLVVTHNANVPVLGDADYVIRMENKPKDEGRRKCVSAVAGCFEEKDVTDSLLELEGGAEAFDFRRHRYSLRS